MRTIYKVFKKNFPLHALGRIGFQSDKYLFRGFENENQNFFIVISECPTPSISNLKYKKEEQSLDFKKKEEVVIFSSVCFENRKTKQKIYKEEALNKFLEMTGLSSKNAVCEFSVQGRVVKGEYPIENCFNINGEFVVEDEDKLKEALKKGIGKRGSYGFGFINFARK